MIPWGEWEFYNIAQNPGKNNFYKRIFLIFLVCVFRASKPLFDNNLLDEFKFHSFQKVVLTRNHSFKMSVNLVERMKVLLRVSYTNEKYSYTVLDEGNEIGDEIGVAIRKFFLSLIHKLNVIPENNVATELNTLSFCFPVKCSTSYILQEQCTRLHTAS